MRRLSVAGSFLLTVLFRNVLAATTGRDLRHPQPTECSSALLSPSEQKVAVHDFDLNELPPEELGLDASPLENAVGDFRTLTDRQRFLGRFIRDRIPNIDDMIEQVRLLHQQPNTVGIPVQTDPNRIPHLRFGDGPDPELIAAHYMLFFDPDLNGRRRYHGPRGNRLYCLSLMRYIICYFGHRAQQPLQFQNRHPTGSLSDFYQFCNGLRICDARSKHLIFSERRRARYQRPRPMAETGHFQAAGVRYFQYQRRWSLAERTALFSKAEGCAVCLSPESLTFVERRPVLRQLLATRELNAPLPLVAQFELDPGLGLWIRRLCSAAFERMDLVAAWYLKYFDLDAQEMLALQLRTADQSYLIGMECLLFCYYQHFEADDARFRLQFPSKPWHFFTMFCCSAPKCQFSE